jgi:uncharacterized protein YggE
MFRNIMKRHHLAATVVVFLMGPLTSRGAHAGPTQESAQRDARREPVVVTTGSAVLKRTPDRAFVNIGAEARAVAPKAAQAQNAKTMTAVRERLKAFGIPDQAIETRGLDLQPEFDYSDGRQKLRGYVARNILEVRLDDVTRVGEVIDASVEAGANAIHDVRFDLKDRSGVEREALKAAVVDALARASALASGAGKTVDRIVTIEEHRAEVIPMQRSVMFAQADAARAQTPVAPGEVEIRATVTVTAAIK